jgi:hypothetical protein
VPSIRVGLALAASARKTHACVTAPRSTQLHRCSRLARRSDLPPTGLSAHYRSGERPSRNYSG